MSLPGTVRGPGEGRCQDGSGQCNHAAGGGSTTRLPAHVHGAANPLRCGADGLVAGSSVVTAITRFGGRAHHRVGGRPGGKPHPNRFQSQGEL
jgi:hypothetical protein